MRGIWVRLAIGGGLLIIGLIVAITVLNQTVYTPSGFVRGYLDAIARHDLSAALSMAGPSPTSSAREDLLREEVLGTLESYRVTETAAEDGIHTVSVEYVVDGRSGRTAFQVAHAGSVLGVFPTFGFAASPLAKLELTVAHARDFTVNGVRFVAPVQDVASTYLAITPGVVTVAHESALLRAEPQTIVLGSPQFERSVRVDAQANDRFVDLVTGQVTAYLDACATQERLFPVGCPFGQVIDDRLASSPQWSILAYPDVEIQPTNVPGEWVVPAAPGIARLQVDVRSIADGEVAPFDTEISFSVGFIATFVGAAEVIVTPNLGGH